MKLLYMLDQQLELVQMLLHLQQVLQATKRFLIEIVFIS